MLILGVVFDDDQLICNLKQERNVQSAKISVNESTKQKAESFHSAAQIDINKIQISHLEYDMKLEIVDFVEKGCLDISRQMISTVITDPTVQREVAYTILVAARKRFWFHEPDRLLLRELHKVEIRDEEEFIINVYKILEICPDSTDRLYFDLVIRQYNSLGEEVKNDPNSPFPTYDLDISQLTQNQRKSKASELLNDKKVTLEVISLSKSESIVKDLSSAIQLEPTQEEKMVDKKEENEEKKLDKHKFGPSMSSAIPKLPNLKEDSVLSDE